MDLDNDFSSRSFNFREMGGAVYNTPEERKRWSLMDVHCSANTIANAMKGKSTYHPLPENYYYQRLYTA